VKTLIIAEAGVNHNGDLRLARELVSRAADAGADLVKFQTFETASTISKSAPKAAYQKESTDPTESQYDMVKKLELSRDAHFILREDCLKRGIGFFSTAFDFKSYDLLHELGVQWVKIPSGEITNLPLVRYMTRHHKPVILSTGMSNLGEVEAAISAIEAGGTTRDKITVLHCTTEYPAPFEDVNLQAMVTMRNAFQIKVGYSDHTVGIEIPVAAVALGATVIEKHFTLDNKMVGPDHAASLEPSALAAMVKAIRNVEKATGDGMKRVSASESKNLAIARKSLVARTAIKSGEVFTPENVTTKRPGTGISPMHWDEVMGKVAKRDFSEEDMIET
jgi:N,N'-diacetyllegionaminate synthase